MTSNDLFIVRYLHMYELTNFSGITSLSAGDNVGKVGTTGDSTGNHLHIDIQKSGNYYDPEAFWS